MSKEINVLDDLLLRLAAGGSSGEEMERQSGIPAAQAIVHVKRLLQNRDIWTELERRQLLLLELNELKDSLKKNALEVKDPQHARLLLQTLTAIASRLDSENKRLDLDVQLVTEHQAKIMGNAFNIALEHVKKELAAQFPDVPKGDIDKWAHEGLVKAKFELAAEGGMSE